MHKYEARGTDWHTRKPPPSPPPPSFFRLADAAGKKNSADSKLTQPARRRKISSADRDHMKNSTQGTTDSELRYSQYTRVTRVVTCTQLFFVAGHHDDWLVDVAAAADDDDDNEDW